MEKKEHLALYSTKCKSCAYLFPDETRFYKTCHYKLGNNGKGNRFCPAADLQIVIVGRIMNLVKMLKAARFKRDAKSEARILASVAKESESFIERFYHYLENGAGQ